MANTLNSTRQEFWASAFQTLYKPYSVYGQIAEMMSTDVKQGYKLNRVLPATTYIQKITPGSDLSLQDLNATNQYLEVDKYRGGLFPIYDWEVAQTNLPLMKQYGKNMSIDLTNVIDSDYLYEARNAASTIDASSVGGGTAGVPLTVTGSNILNAITTAKESLFNTSFGYSDGDLFCAVDPGTIQIMEAYDLGRETPGGDRAIENGAFQGRMWRFAGVDFYVTANYTRQIVLALATQPTDGDTVTLTVGGTAVTFTFVAAIGTTPGNVLIGADVDTTRASFVALVNDPRTTSATQVALSAANAALFETSMTAVNSNSANTATFYAKGKSISGTETLTDATDGFNATYAGKHLMFGRRNKTAAMALQIVPDVMLTQEPRQPTKNVLYQTSYGIKTFNDNAQNSVDLFFAA